MSPKELKDFLDEKAEQYSQPGFFIETDPIQVPHAFSSPKDQEVAGFLTALISWGQRKTIITNAQLWLELMDNAPYEFLMEAQPSDFNRFARITHRTLNGEDAMYITERLSRLIKLHGSINRFLADFEGGCMDKLQALHYFFVIAKTPQRTAKHIANPKKGSAAKRLCMYFRWMTRKPEALGVDFGIWDCLHPADLKLPLDVHTSNVGRQLGLLHRKQNDWKAVEEISEALKKLDPEDPVKYDYALFGLGAFEKF